MEKELIQSEIHDSGANIKLTINVSLGAILAFITGSTYIPPLGFHPQPSIVFKQRELNRKMYVSTCTNTLFFPVSGSLLQYSTFQEEFLFCMLNSPGFGKM